MYGIVDKSYAVGPSPLSSLSGKKFLIVGGTAGIGAALAKCANNVGALVTVVGRTNRSVSPITFVKCDLSSMKSCVSLVDSMDVSTFDYIAFTAGLVPGSTKVTTEEGGEQDMATSALSRVVMLRAMMSHLKPGVRVFNWGFPGSKGYMEKTNLADFNSEIKYAGGFGFTHMNTVAVNEALVFFYASKGVEIYGLNPGLIASGIRDSLHGGGCCGGCLEGIISCFNPSADQYINKLLPVLISPTLSAHRGAFFSQAAKPILPSPEFAATTSAVGPWMAAAEALADKSLSNSTGASKAGLKLNTVEA